MAGMNIMPGRTVEGRRGPRIDFYLVLAALLLLFVGYSSLYSEGMTRDGGGVFRKQMINGLVGLVPFSLFAFINPRVWQRASVGIYIFNLLLLLAVLVKGKVTKGAARWIDIGPMQFQPSELSKLLIVLTLAAFYASRQDRIDKLSTLGLGFLHALIPGLLILKQPHLGAFTVVIVSWFAISLVANVPGKFLIGPAVAALVVVAVVFLSPPLRAKVLPSYQLDRVEGLHAKNDPSGKNWQTNRAEIAFGVGGVTGTGFGNGQQKAGHFIPEQHNDFIFTVVGEEGGLVGCTLVLAAFAFLFYRIFMVMLVATDIYFRMIAAGIFAVLGFHTFANIAMVLQIIPVVGLWLPFISSGGTALWLCMAFVGLLLNIRSREKPILF